MWNQENRWSFYTITVAKNAKSQEITRNHQKQKITRNNLKSLFCESIEIKWILKSFKHVSLWGQLLISSFDPLIINNISMVTRCYPIKGYLQFSKFSKLIQQNLQKPNNESKSVTHLRIKSWNHKRICVHRFETKLPVSGTSFIRWPDIFWGFFCRIFSNRKVDASRDSAARDRFVGPGETAP